MKYRGKVNVEFVTGRKITVEHVVNANDIDTANKICAIEFHGSYKNNDRVKEYHIIPCVEDTTKRPSEEFVRDRLLIANDLNNSESARQQAKEQIYKAFKEYQPSWDDDELSDVLSYCEEGVIEEYGKPDEIAKGLVEELDGMWCCHYIVPGIELFGQTTPSLEEQYRKAMN